MIEVKKTTPKFVPITINITIKSQEDLKQLYEDIGHLHEIESAEETVLSEMIEKIEDIIRKSL